MPRSFNRNSKRERSGESILDHIRAHVPADGPGLLDGGATLPDEDENQDGSRIRWAPGAMDGVATHHMGSGGDDEHADGVFDLIFEALADRPPARAFDRLYEHVQTGNAIGLVDSVLERVARSPLQPARVHDLGLRLATRSRHREPVKLGIALLGLIQGPDHGELLTTLARHEEFTLYCAVALEHTSDDPESALWQLARQVEGWGRIHLVERLRDTRRDDIKRWILREGFRNQVMYEYLAYIAATTGDLAGALAVERPDDQLLDAAGEIVSALIAGGPAETIDDYRDAPEVAERLVDQLAARDPQLADFLVIDHIEGYLTGEDDRWPAREQQGWTVERRDRLIAACRAFKDRPVWRELATRGLAEDDPAAFDQAAQVARMLGVDTFPAHWRRVLADPIGGNWWAVMQMVTEDTIDEVIDHAERTLPLNEIASGPADSLGLGPEFRAHMAVTFVVQDLGGFPGKGWQLVAAALRSPVVSNRNTALRALDAWGRERWPAEAAAALRQAAADEPNDQVRQSIQRVLDGQPLNP